MDYPNGFYRGRLACDGQGNLLADEGEYAGYPVAFHDGSYVFVQPGEPSHNDRHHKQFTEPITGTVDESMTDDPDLVNADSTTNAHHFETQPDDPHYDEEASNKTRVKQNPDSLSRYMTGHTESWKRGNE